MSSKLIRLAFTTILCFSGTTMLVADDADWVSLFDGKTMDGWEKVGNEKSVWEVHRCWSIRLGRTRTFAIAPK
jgi:hypothetical protein